MGKAAAESTDGQKMVPADCVSVLLMAVGSTTISKSQYDMMSALDGTRTASSFEHQFRSITAKARDLKARVDNGEKFQPVRPANKRSSTTNTASPATPSKRKAADGDIDDTPSKKKTSPRKSPAKKQVPTQSPEVEFPGHFTEDDGVKFLEETHHLVKQKNLWEDSYM